MEVEYIGQPEMLDLEIVEGGLARGWEGDAHIGKMQLQQ